MQRINRRTVIGSAIAVGVAGALAIPWWLPPLARTPDSAGRISDAPLFDDQGDPVLGNVHGTLPIAEFFDYRCPYCHRMHPLITRLLREYPDIRYVAKEWPVFGGASVAAARMALAANWQGKFALANDALFAATGGLDEAKIRAAAKAAGIDMARLDHDLSARGSELQRILERVSVQAATLGLQGTPGFVIGNYLVPSALSYGELLKVVAEARAKLEAHGDARVRQPLKKELAR